MKIDLTQPARSLRRRTTDAERKLWSRLRDRKLNGFKFKRQAPRGRYVVDFLCVEAGVVVEVDGGQHADSFADPERTAQLEREELMVLRFGNSDILKNMDGVLAVIAETVVARAPSPGARSAPSSPQGERRTETVARVK
jgi:very-short-patch-repair endonuclease